MQDIYKVAVIKPGIVVRDRFGYILDARSTVTLISGGDLDIVVDTGVTDERDAIIAGLRRYDLTPADIDILINTHSHIDHTGNNELFSKARFIGHESEDWGTLPNNKCDLIKKNMEIYAGINIIETPGHTKGSVTVLLLGLDTNDLKHRFAITGDALPIMDNYLKWVPPGINYDPKLALESMKKIVDNAEMIIPGHDKPFKIIKGDQRTAEYL